MYARQGPTEGADIFIIYRAEVAGGDLAPATMRPKRAILHADDLPELAFASTERVVANWLAGDSDQRPG